MNRSRVLALLKLVLVWLVLLAASVAAASGAASGAAQEAARDAAEHALLAAGFVEPAKLDPGLVLDIRYATADNFTGKPVYPSARCFLRREVAERMLAAQAELRRQGLGLKVYDCYRPFSVQEIFWKIMPDERYVLKPVRENGVIKVGSRHNRGAAVDVGLVDASGRELPMPTAFEDFSEKAHRTYRGAPAEAIRNREILERAMSAQGFELFPTEWWHFDGPGWKRHEMLDLPLPR